MTLRVYNTLTRQKEDFQTLVPGQVRMYLCGPTVYKPAHIGHMVGPVIFDTVKRFLNYNGYQVKFVINITDVDDKLINRARENENDRRSPRPADDAGLLRQPRPRSASTRSMSFPTRRNTLPACRRSSAG